MTREPHPARGAPATLSMAATAAACGISRERFRKVWKTWVRDLAFPPPFRRPEFVSRDGRAPRRTASNYAWRAQAVEDWKAGRERVFGEGQAVPAANDAPPPREHFTPPRNSGLDRERAELRRMMRSN